MTKPSSYMDMARAVERVANEHIKILADARLGNVIIPSKADIAIGGIDYAREADHLIAASRELTATARLLQTNFESTERRKVG